MPPPIAHTVVLQVDGADAARFESVARELLTRIDVTLVTTKTHDASSSKSLLQVTAHVADNSGGFEARRHVGGPIVARADMTYETTELLREALAHSLLSLVEAVLQGQPVPKELQSADVTAPQPAPEHAPKRLPEPSPNPVSPLDVVRRPTTVTPPIAPSHDATSRQLPWRVSIASTAALASAALPLFGANLRVERDLTRTWRAGVKVDFARSPEFTEHSYTIGMQRWGAQALLAWRALGTRETSLLPAAFVGVTRETAEATKGNGALSGPQSEWLPSFGVGARLRQEWRLMSLEADLGVRVYPKAPRLLVRQADAAITLLEPWGVQPELGLGVGVSF